MLDCECKNLHQDFLRTSQSNVTSLADSALLFHLDKKRKNCLSGAFNRLAWNIINNMTDKTRHTQTLCPIIVNSIVSRLVKNGIFKTTHWESARCVVKKVSLLWRISTQPDKCISGDFFSEEFANAFQLFKSGKAPVPDSMPALV